ncbi:MAG: A/G-specific adenine glycosylase [Bacteroidetes bacterium]|nr:A/G-specific adenine glycosylase [Bacteroidota bacterium]
MDFSKTIIKWYDKNKRNLSFRKTKDPYRIWLSEIILQQTRVSQGLPYYERFVQLFPTIHHLAKAKEDVVMKVWQGLGYYTRARNLHHTAKHISTKLKGKFPNEFDEIKKLKGIGDYTAGAIASLAFNKPHVVVDGNVFRVLSRYFGIKTPIDSSEGKKVFKKKAEELLDKKNPGTFNQAVMEFGALQCVPQNPDCGKCSLKKSCIAYSKNLVGVLPIKSKKTKIRTRYFNYLVFRNKGKILIRKRTENDIWKNLYDFPLVETKKEMKPIPPALPKGKGENKLQVLPFGKDLGWAIPSQPFKHVLSHQVILARFWEVKKSGNNNFFTNRESTYINENQLHKYAFPRLIVRYFDEKIA